MQSSLHGKVQHILLDFDGTIINSGEGIYSAFECMFKELGRPIPLREEMRWAIGPGLRAVVERLFPKETVAFQETCIKIFRHHYDGEEFKKTTLYPGMVDLLSELPQWGYRTYLTTMKGRPGAEEIVRYFSLERYFVQRYAPHPAGPVMRKEQLLAEVVEKEGLERERTVVVGDTAHDISSARANGLSSIGITWGYGREEELRSLGADLIAHSVGELRGLLAPRAE